MVESVCVRVDVVAMVVGALFGVVVDLGGQVGRRVVVWLVVGFLRGASGRMDHAFHV